MPRSDHAPVEAMGMAAGYRLTIVVSPWILGLSEWRTIGFGPGQNVKFFHLAATLNQAPERPSEGCRSQQVGATNVHSQAELFISDVMSRPRRGPFSGGGQLPITPSLIYTSIV